MGQSCQLLESSGDLPEFQLPGYRRRARRIEVGDYRFGVDNTVRLLSRSEVGRYVGLLAVAIRAERIKFRERECSAKHQYRPVLPDCGQGRLASRVRGRDLQHVILFA